jgi:hypothetical protein
MPTDEKKENSDAEKLVLQQKLQEQQNRLKKNREMLAKQQAITPETLLKEKLKQLEEWLRVEDRKHPEHRVYEKAQPMVQQWIENFIAIKQRKKPEPTIQNTKKNIGQEDDQERCESDTPNM